MCLLSEPAVYCVVFLSPRSRALIVGYFAAVVSGCTCVLEWFLNECAVLPCGRFAGRMTMGGNSTGLVPLTLDIVFCLSRT